MAATEGNHETAASGHGGPGLPGDESGGVPGNRIGICQYSNLQRELPMRPLASPNPKFTSLWLARNPKFRFSVIPAKAGIQVDTGLRKIWTPVFTGVTNYYGMLSLVSNFLLLCLFLHVSSELVTHRRQYLVRKVCFPARAESLIQRRREDRRGNSLIDRRLGGPAPLA
jgi:hypothetical protein